MAQKTERESTRYELDVPKASRPPALNLEGYMGNKSKQVYLNMQWNLFDEASRHTVNKKSGHRLAVMLGYENEDNQL